MVDRDRLAVELKKMRTLIETDPEVKARFDLDGNGVIDGFEWEQVRRLVIARLEREEAEAEALLAEGELPSGRDDTTLSVAHRQDLLRLKAQERRRAQNAVDHDAIVLEQVKFLGGLRKRRYLLKREHDGVAIASFSQNENELVQSATTSAFNTPNLTFSGSDGLTEQSLSLERTTHAVAGYQMFVSVGTHLKARVTAKLKLFRATLEVRCLTENVSYTVKRMRYRPWTFDILDPFDEPIGLVRKGWRGIGGPLTGGALTHIQFHDPQLVDGARWGMVAAAVLLDIGSGRR